MSEIKDGNVSARPTTIVLAAGGTGGHVFPALAIADALKTLKPDIELVFVGTKDRIEARVVPQHGFRFETIWISGIRRSLRPGNLLVPLKASVALVQSFFLMKRLKPAVVIGTGGYVCGPVLFASTTLGIPTVIHESNSYPGITTRLLARRVQRVFLAFEDAVVWLKGAKNTEVVGTPTRSTMGSVSRKQAIKFFGLSDGKLVLLILGGSQGAAAINEAILNFVDSLQNARVQVIWQTGERHFKGIQDRLGKRMIGWVGPFIQAMEMAYAAADLVVSRAGATTIAELTLTGSPAVLVPYPHAAGDHQTRNAQSLVKAGAAELVREEDLGKLKTTVLALLKNRTQRNAMRKSAKKLAHPKAASIIAQRVLELQRSWKLK
ncbi:MAG: undecaprenyldiphospho-muramoylpentapeptide beta-N-acetylglucosaminyltransferase [Bacteroidota bacterium]